jgi:hypothetical protein
MYEVAGTLGEIQSPAQPGIHPIKAGSIEVFQPLTDDRCACQRAEKQ